MPFLKVPEEDYDELCKVREIIEDFKTKAWREDNKEHYEQERMEYIKNKLPEVIKPIFFPVWQEFVRKELLGKE